MKEAEIEVGLEEVFGLFGVLGEGDYLGEAVSKTVHSIQCGMLAERAGASTEEILGAFFHDIGHLEGERRGLKNMMFEDTVLGIINHGALGAEYLEGKGFEKSVTDIVRNHVQAKRYLCYKDKAYHDGLSWASKRTLEHQGGPMSAAQAEKFESHPQFECFIKMRHWDEEAKDPNWKDLQPLTYFKNMSRNYLISLKH